ncbi:hypothetical protein AX15_007798 [Amanita polypyramis BW_CC]|nr:hypothetical protein AX15_007798 [Amanita polypyramis BW_CC]
MTSTGQAESGKSSVLKNFQIAFAPKQFNLDRAMWKLVIHLNIIGQLRMVLDIIDLQMIEDPKSVPLPNNLPGAARQDFVHNYRLQLSPLFFIETRIIELICPEYSLQSDFCLRASTGWRERLRNVSISSTPEYRRRSELDPSIILHALKDKATSLWSYDYVKNLMNEHPRLQMGGIGSSFLDDIDRIAALNYEPTNLDIIRARIRTTGAEEHMLQIEKGGGVSGVLSGIAHTIKGNQVGSCYYITDVGGSKSQRASWASFFDDVHAIIFLAPLAFNQYLEDDPSVNRLEDSVNLWKETCSSKILAKAELILFLNKKDILEETLASGVRVKDYVSSYNGSDNPEEVTEFFKLKFKNYQKRLSPVQRRFICYYTSAIDIRAMNLLLAHVKDTIIIQNLKQMRALV